MGAKGRLWDPPMGRRPPWSQSLSRHRQMWQVAWEDKSVRIVSIPAVLLDDERRNSHWFDVRNCDYAGALPERVSDVDATARP